MDFKKIEEDLIEKHGRHIREVDVISAAMYPSVTDDFLQFRETYGPVDTLDTNLFLVGPKMAQEVQVKCNANDIFAIVRICYDKKTSLYLY